MKYGVQINKIIFILWVCIFICSFAHSRNDESLNKRKRMGDVVQYLNTHIVKEVNFIDADYQKVGEFLSEEGKEVRLTFSFPEDEGTPRLNLYYQNIKLSDLMKVVSSCWDMKYCIDTETVTFSKKKNVESEAVRTLSVKIPKDVMKYYNKLPSSLPKKSDYVDLAYNEKEEMLFVREKCPDGIESVRMLIFAFTGNDYLGNKIKKETKQP